MVFNKIYVSEEHIGKRVDSFLSERLGISRSKAKLMVESGFVKQSSVISKISYKVKEGTLYYRELENEELSLVPEDIDIDIVYEDSSIAVINKEAGIVVHPGAGQKSGTLVNALLYKIKDLSGINYKIRPGIVHRLDRETSGLIVIAKNDEAHHNLANQFKNRKVTKAYYALVKGNPIQKSGKIVTNISRCKKSRIKMAVSVDGKEAITFYEVIAHNSIRDISLLKVSIETGRTHQIRVHLSHIGFPILGDALYGHRESYSRHYLHCYKLSFRHPINGSILENISKIPDEFLKEIDSK